MLIDIDDLDGTTWTVGLERVGEVYEDDDVIYFGGAPFRLSSARPAAIRLTPHQPDAAETPAGGGSEPAAAQVMFNGFRRKLLQDGGTMDAKKFQAAYLKQLEEMAPLEANVASAREKLHATAEMQAYEAHNLTQPPASPLLFEQWIVTKDRLFMAVENTVAYSEFHAAKGLLFFAQQRLEGMTAKLREISHVPSILDEEGRLTPGWRPTPQTARLNPVS